MIQIKQLIKITSLWVSIVYIVCFLGVYIYPQIRSIFMKYALHSEVTFTSDFFSGVYLLSGLIIWNIIAILGVGLFAVIYNRISK